MTPFLSVFSFSFNLSSSAGLDRGAKRRACIVKHPPKCLFRNIHIFLVMNNCFLCFFRKMFASLLSLLIPLCLCDIIKKYNGEVFMISCKKLWKLLIDKDIPPIKFHGLRHSFATRCIESHCDYKTVSVILGHSNISTTLNLYVHPNYEQKKNVLIKCLERLSDYI